MTIRFAAANRENSNAVVARIFTASVPLRSANDNVPGTSEDKLLKAALRYFAEHGLSAAECARERAEYAFFAGDRSSYRWWLSICRTLDRRMALAVSTRLDTVDADADVTPVVNTP